MEVELVLSSSEELIRLAVELTGEGQTVGGFVLGMVESGLQIVGVHLFSFDHFHFVANTRPMQSSTDRLKNLQKKLLAEETAPPPGPQQS